MSTSAPPQQGLPRERPAHPRGLGRLGAAAARHPVVVLAIWALAVAAAAVAAFGGIAGQTLFDRLGGGSFTVTGEASRGGDVLSGGTKSEGLVLLVHGVDLDDPDLAATGRRVAEDLAAIPRASLVDPLAVPGGVRNPAVASLVAKDGDGVLFAASVAGAKGHDPSDASVDRMREVLDDAARALRAAHPHATVEVGGSSLLVDSILSLSESDLTRGETVALPIALVVMLVVFGGFLAAGMPLVGAGASIVSALGTVLAMTYLMDIDTTVVNVVTAVGLGLSIDYGLLMVSRFREEYRSAPDRERAARIAAAARTAASAGRTVAFSGTTFAIASLGLLAFEPTLMRAIGIAAIAVTLLSILAALTLVPALLSIAGDRLARPGALTRIPGAGRLIARFGDVAPEEGFFSRLTRLVQRRPALVTIACALALVVVGSPIATLHLANTSVDAVPRASSQHAFTTALADEFPDATSPRVQLVTRTEADAAVWAKRVERLDHVRSVAAPVRSGDGWSALVRVDAREGVDVVQAIRADPPRFPHWVTGLDASTLDFSQSLLRGMPWATLIVVLGTIVLLFLMTGSLVVPLKALLASALSLGASIGLLVWGFEQGHLAGLLHFDAAHVYGVDVVVLVLTIAFGFGLAMDYEMFILSRIKERIDAGLPARAAIALGLQRSGRIITSAALIIIVVFGGFATGDLVFIKQLGVALATAVLIDATVVRCLLVPAIMTWQDRIMWWAPRWMRRVHARIGLAD